MENGILVITGPTCCGKSALALALAEAFGGCVINADAMQVYDLYPKLTAQPDDQDKAKAPHLLYSTVTPPEKCSAEFWAQSAEAVIADCLAKGLLPILTGGTGLYLEFLLHGRSEIPDVHEEILRKAKLDYAKEGGPGLLEKLNKVDHETASRINAGDPARLIRAWSVYLATGKGLSLWQKEGFRPPAHDWSYKTIFMMPGRVQLYGNINARFQKMLEAGVMDEVRDAMRRQLAEDHPAHKAHGARELQNVIEGRWNMERAVARSQQVTRNYAKRQFTWFKNRFMKKETFAGRPLLTIEGGDFGDALQQARGFVKG